MASKDPPFLFRLFLLDICFFLGSSRFQWLDQVGVISVMQIFSFCWALCSEQGHSKVGCLAQHFPLELQNV